jgi:uncharacterized protein YacL
MATRSRSTLVVTEVFRMAIVLGLTALGFATGDELADLVGASDPEAVRLVASVLGALVGYLVGGVVGRLGVRRVDIAQERLGAIEAPVLIAGVLGGSVAALFSVVLLSPVLLLPGRVVTVPLALAIMLLLVYAGVRIGATRGGDLARYLGVRGRVEVRSPSRGTGTRLIDSSALVDGRLVDIARSGFLDGTLVVPQFVLEEVQGLADAQEPRRRALGIRALDVVRTLQEDGIVAVEVTQEDPPDVATVDGKLAAICRSRGAPLVTTDANLAQVAEVGGVRVLNVNALAEAVRPPAVPGDRLAVRVIRDGTEPQQGVGFLDDGTMVVVERAAALQGEEVTVDVTSIVTNRRGRMLFAVLAEERDA